MNYQHPVINRATVNEVSQLLFSGKLSGFRGTPEGQDGGAYVQKLEQAFRDYFQIKYAVAMNSATACLHSACVACGVKDDNDVFVTPFSFVSSASCVLTAGGNPIFLDIDEDTFCLNIPDEDEMENPTFASAIIPVHLMGHPVDMDEIMRGAKINSWMVIEDAAQALGAEYKGRKVGTIGDCGVFSFNQSKHVSTGEGGMLITNSNYIYRVARAMRNHGEVSDPELNIAGYNYRMCEVEALLALRQFEDLDNMNSWRIQLADYMSRKLEQFAGLTPPVTKPDCKHVFYTYAVKYDESKMGMPRDIFQEELMKRGVYFGKGYGKPLYRLPVFGSQENLCPVAERMFEKELCVFDWLRYPCTTDDVDEAIKVISDVLHND